MCSIMNVIHLNLSGQPSRPSSTIQTSRPTAITSSPTRAMSCSAQHSDAFGNDGKSVGLIWGRYLRNRSSPAHFNGGRRLIVDATQILVCIARRDILNPTRGGTHLPDAINASAKVPQSAEGPSLFGAVSY